MLQLKKRVLSIPGLKRGWPLSILLERQRKHKSPRKAGTGNANFQPREEYSCYLRRGKREETAETGRSDMRSFCCCADDQTANHEAAGTTRRRVQQAGLVMVGKQALYTPVDWTANLNRLRHAADGRRTAQTGLAVRYATPTFSRLVSTNNGITVSYRHL